MSMLFAPAVSLMQRLRYPLKFALIGLVAFVTVAYLVTVLSLSLGKTIGQSRLELEGIESIRPVLRRRTPKMTACLKRVSGAMKQRTRSKLRAITLANSLSRT